MNNFLLLGLKLVQFTLISLLNIFNLFLKNSSIFPSMKLIYKLSGFEPYNTMNRLSKGQICYLFGTHCLYILTVYAVNALIVVKSSLLQERARLVNDLDQTRGAAASAVVYVQELSTIILLFTNQRLQLPLVKVILFASV